MPQAVPDRDRPGGLLPVALAALSLGRPHVDDLIRAAVAGGFAGIGLTPRTPEARWQSWALDPEAVARVRTACAARRLAVSDVGVLTVDAESPLGDADALARCAAAVGAPRLVLMCRDPYAPRAARTVRSVAGIAADHGLQIAVEPMPYTPLHDIRAALRLIELVEMPNVGILLDLFQHVRAGLGADDLTEERVERVVLVQLSDGMRHAPGADRLREEALTDRRYPGQGEFPLHRLLDRLPAGVPMTVEAPCGRYASLPLSQQAVALADATRQVLAPRPRSPR